MGWEFTFFLFFSSPHSSFLSFSAIHLSFISSTILPLLSLIFIYCNSFSPHFPLFFIFFGIFPSIHLFFSPLYNRVFSPSSFLPLYHSLLFLSQSKLYFLSSSPFPPCIFFCMTLHSSFSNENFLCCLSMICLFLFCLFDFVFFPPLLYLCLSFDWVILHSPTTRQSTPFIPLLSLLPRLPLSIFLSLPCVIFH